jgi:maltose O-acetyltransferase
MRNEVAAGRREQAAEQVGRRVGSPLDVLKNASRRLAQQFARAWFFTRLDYAYRLWGMDEVNRALLLGRRAYVVGILSRFGATVGDDPDLHAPLTIHNAHGGYHNLRIGDGCHLGQGVFLDLMDQIEMGDRVTVSMGVMILTHTDVGRSPLRQGALPPTRAPVTIESGAYLGARAILLQGVTVGTCAVVAAGAVVVDDVPAGAVVAGVPARPIKSTRPVDQAGLTLQDQAAGAPEEGRA